MANSIGCNQRHYPEKQDRKAEKLDGQRKLKVWNVTVANPI